MDGSLSTSLLLLFLILNVQPGISSESKIARRPLSIPSYFEKNTVERLLNAKSNNFYKKSEQAICDAAKHLEFQGEAWWKLFLKKAEKENEDTVCIDAIKRAVLDYYLGRQYARQMSDSMGRRESGLLKGNYIWTGRYFECLDATNKKEVTGQMCEAILSGQPGSATAAGLTVGVCVPDVCNEQELTAIFQNVFLNDTGLYTNILCPDEVKFGAADITAFVVFGILGALLISATLYEIFLILNAKQSENASYQENSISALGRLTLSFSIIKNTKALLNLKQKEGNLECLHGLRFISMAWIILGHTLANIISFTDNIVDISEYYITHGSLQAIANGTFSVDTFFFLSGLLVAYLGLREMDKRNGKINVPLMYLSRYLRLTPSMGIVILFSVGLYYDIGYGILYQPVVQIYTVDLCQKYWWTNLLYINNLYPTNINDQCIGWVWYLANDMQFYLLAPIYLLLFYRYPKVGLGVVAFTIVGSLSITWALSSHFKLIPDVITMADIFRYLANIGTAAPPASSTSTSYWKDIYAKPWCRIGVYVIGITTGYIIHITKRKLRMNEVFVTLMWAAVIAVELTVVYGFCGNVLYDYYPTNGAMSFYNAVARPVWALGLAWVTIACVSGYGGPINKFLSWKFFIPLSRLTYCAYLIHPLLILYTDLSREIEMHFAINIIIYYYLAIMVLSYAFAYVLSMTVEAPMIGIQKFIFPKSKRNQDVQEIEEKVHQKNGQPISINGHVALEKSGIDNEIVMEDEDSCHKL